ncbi:phosphoenolpyruvate carboxykinase (ATP) [Thermus thermamylovorans]|uniref:Phosphoenolpyruvate carboxykinase (ATP) n=1 Tax=Thermus thermamylovorans TaxID=2509362 RepID=A0A4Q9B540_9DEIN|nr:phosphoenolpyruvate carboxykinase (ATP) [Thermus thermamylovorans]TBH20472.1 phosphoenolpyruvate carboxykinase (ATP) [Thermus thermamylovorans]
MDRLSYIGIEPKKRVFWDAASPVLVEHTLSRGEGFLAHKGPLVVDTTPYTGRSPRDKFVVREPEVEEEIWWGEVNQPFAPEAFQALLARVAQHLSERDLYVQDLYAGADRRHRLAVRVVTESPWHALFARNMFLLPRRFPLDDEVERFVPGFTVVHAPHFLADPERDGTKSEVFVGISFARRLVLIVGTKYAGEIKKSIFTVMNYLMPKRGVFPMHASANVGQEGDVALFFGLSGTGKTTLSTDPQRPLIGDDEHGWSEEGVFNFEGGCYAKVIRLSEEHEPLIFRASNQFESILENVVVNPESRRVEWDDDTKTENTRASYPIAHLENVVDSGMAGHPRAIFFLSADAYGVLPPIARLSPEQAMYYFLSGYTARVAGTERGVTEPKATFSACFGAPFLPMHPGVYARMLGEKIQRHAPRVYLVNTGWTGGPYGVGRRFPLPLTRALLGAALSGALEGVPYRQDPVFGFEVPLEVPGVPQELLNPRETWADPEAYDRQAQKLAALFQDNFQKYADGVTEAIRQAGPKGA